MGRKKSRAVMAAIARKQAARNPKKAEAPAAKAAPKAAAKKSPKAKAQAAPKGKAESKTNDTPIFAEDAGAGNDKFKTYDNDFCMGMKAPSLKTLDWVDNKDYERPADGKPYLILIWAQYHKPGYKFIAEYSKLAEKYRGRLPIVAAAIDPNKKDGPQKFIEDPAKKYSKGSFPLEYAVAHDPAQTVKKAFAAGLRATLSPPHAFLVDGKGVVVWHQDHSELGATVPTYLALMDKQIASFLKSGKVASVGARAVEESSEEEEDSDDGAVVADDLDLF